MFMPDMALRMLRGHPLAVAIHDHGELLNMEIWELVSVSMERL